MTAAERAAALVTATACEAHVVVSLGATLIAVRHSHEDAAELLRVLREQIAGEIEDAETAAAYKAAGDERSRVVKLTEAHRAAWDADGTPRGLGHREACVLLACGVWGHATSHLKIAPPGAEEPPR